MTNPLIGVLVTVTIAYWLIKWSVIRGSVDGTIAGWIVGLWILGRAVLLAWVSLLVYHAYHFLLRGMSPVTAVVMIVFGIGGVVFCWKFYVAATEVERMKPER